MGVPLFETEVTAASSLTTTASFDITVFATTALDAVNEMLASVGEQPVSSLVQTTPTVHMAMQYLARSTRRVQSHGWYWNTEQDVLVEADANSKFPTGPTWIRFWAAVGSYPGKRLVMRNGFIYDLINRTYLLALASIKVQVVYWLNWDEIPENARSYITARATRRFHASVVGDDKRQAWLKEDEDRMWEELLVDDGEQAGYNIFAGGAARMTILRGRTPRGNSAFEVLPAVEPGGP